MADDKKQGEEITVAENTYIRIAKDEYLELEEGESVTIRRVDEENEESGEDESVTESTEDSKSELNEGVDELQSFFDAFEGYAEDKSIEDMRWAVTQAIELVYGDEAVDEFFKPYV